MIFIWIILALLPPVIFLSWTTFDTWRNFAGICQDWDGSTGLGPNGPYPCSFERYYFGGGDGGFPMSGWDLSVLLAMLWVIFVNAVFVGVKIFSYIRKKIYSYPQRSGK